MATMALRPGIEKSVEDEGIFPAAAHTEILMIPVRSQRKFRFSFYSRNLAYNA